MAAIRDFLIHWNEAFKNPSDSNLAILDSAYGLLREELVGPAKKDAGEIPKTEQKVENKPGFRTPNSLKPSFPVHTITDKDSTVKHKITGHSADIMGG